MQRPWQRLLVFAILAAGLAHAINKLFIPELEADASVYAGLMGGMGAAPDQYRILPILLLSPFTHGLGWSHGVLVSNCVAGFIVFHQLWEMSAHRGIKAQAVQTFIFAIAFIFTLITGWRPETLWVLVVFNLTVPWILAHQASTLRFVIAILLLSLTRADVAVWLSAALVIDNTKAWPWALSGTGLGIGIQYILMQYVFPDATYYTHVVMIMDNLSGWYLFRNPSTYMILGAGLIWWKDLRSWFMHRLDSSSRRLLIACMLYVCLIFAVGRINEYRLYLWLIPLCWWIDRNSIPDLHG